MTRAVMHGGAEKLRDEHRDEMDSPSPVAADEQGQALATIVTAFADDPVERWLFPQTEQYLQYFPLFVAAFAGDAFDNGTAWALGELSAVALWLAPGDEPDGEAIVKVLSDNVAPDKHEDTFTVLEQMDQSHPTFPHWYLPWLAVSPALQGNGLGSRLLARGLTSVDESGLPAYLETPNPRTVPLYERHGFQTVAIAQHGSCPPMTLMLRDAR
jgi:ribosomal protein S18 acetylase RimI-like enzyme